ncbi:MAG TPA: hypothetical protein VG322_09610 [Candidatus Acidoferrales bacterium]|jgi:hypothetical protein|nr:hypothetical protein [Candidatus Acidoferrales bacterium]
MIAGRNSASIAAFLLLLFCTLLRAQTAGQRETQRNRPPATAPADLTGVWTQYPHISGASTFADFSFSKDEPPMTPWAIAKYKAAKPVHVGGYQGKSDDTTLTCFPPGVPRIYLFNFPMEIFEIPGRVLIVYEYGHYIRQVYTDGRQHPKDVNPTWMGDSIGKWDGNTLVVDTVGFNDETWLDQVGHPHSESLHLVERIHKTAPDMLRIDFTFDDPVAYTKPWTATKQFKLRPDWHISEYVCEETFINKGVDEISK